MAKTKKQNQKNTSTASNNDSIKNNNDSATTKVKRTRKTVPRNSPQQRSSIYRGVTRHRWTGRYEAHLWDKNCWNESQNKKGRQVYLGAYHDEEAAAHAYDLAALKYWGQDTILNFPLSTYEEELKEMNSQSKEEYIGSLRRKSSGFSRGVSKYRGVARHHHNGRWEARIGRVFGNKYLYLGTYATQEEAAAAYDMAAIEYRGLNAVTNFDLSRYVKWLHPNHQSNPSHFEPNSNGDLSPIPNQNPQLGLDLSPSHETSSANKSTSVLPRTAMGGGGGNSTSSALGLLLQSTKFQEMLERTSTTSNHLSPPPEASPPRRSFPDDIQTYFDCHEPSSHVEGDDIIFGDLNPFTSTFFHSELEA